MEFSVETQFFRLLNQLVEPHVRAGWASPRMVPGGLIVLETVGRRSGRRSRVPLAAVRIDGHVVVSTFRGARSQWVKNAAANPDVRYWLRGRPRHARAVVLTSERDAPGQAQLPAAVRWLLRAATPYTYAGWAFAVLVPQRKNDAAIATGRRRNSSGGWSHRSRAARRRRRGGGGG